MKHTGMKAGIIMLMASVFPTQAFGQELTVHGDFKRMMHTGDKAGTVALDTLDVPQAWGVGATAGLRGEILILDGKVLVSRGSDPDALTGAPDSGEQAAFLAYGQAVEWKGFTLPHDMNSVQLAHFVGMQADEFNLDMEKGFPVRLKGIFPKLTWHVVTGEAPKHDAEKMAGHDAGQGGHANSRSGMNLYHEDGAAGEIVGVFAGSANEGKASHPGEMLHLHFVTEDGKRSGHVDEVVIAAGSELLLPVKMKKAATPQDNAAHTMASHSGVMIHDAGLPEGVAESGQSAFAAIQEIVAKLMADPATDWQKVNIEALRMHLIDMDNVTLRAKVDIHEIERGARFHATSVDPAVTASIRAMVPAHVATMNGVEGWQMTAEEITGGAALTITGADTARIRALGFIGVMTVGMHHQAHHLALASGSNPHDH